MKYKVGDKVKVRSDLIVGKFYGSRFVNDRMAKTKTITIEKVEKDSYIVYDGRSTWWYTDEMLDGLVEPKIEGYTLDELKDIIKEYEERNKPCMEVEEQKPKTIWDLKVGDTYWFVNINEVSKLAWDNSEVDNSIRNQGDCFLTEEEAEFELEARKVYAIFKKHSCVFRHGKENWTIYYDYESNKMNLDYYSVFKTNTLYFKSEEILQKAIEEAGEDRVLKYYLKVK